MALLTFQPFNKVKHDKYKYQPLAVMSEQVKD